MTATVPSSSASTSEPLDIAGGLAIGDIVRDGDIHVHGNVSDTVSILTRGRIVIDGVCSASRVEAGSTLAVNGGIKGAGRATYRAAGNISAHYIDNATVETDASILIDSEALNNRLVCAGRVIIHGALVAGHTIATGGVRCRVLGSPLGNARTILEVGLDPALQAAAPGALEQIQSRLAKAAKLRTTVAPIMRNQRWLTAQQKEEATELLFQADELEHEANQILTRMRALIEGADKRSLPRIRVMTLLHPPVTIRMPGLEADIHQELHGPLWIAPRGIGRNQYLAIIKSRRITTPLNTRTTPDPVLTELRKLLVNPA